MANILQVDANETARKALKGLLARGSHHFAAVATTAEAWDFVQRNVAVDLIVLELKLEGENGLTLVERLRADSVLKDVPVLIYTTVADRDSVRRAVQLHVQNYLMKPYRDDVVFGEVAKIMANPWRNKQFEEEKSFCAMMGYTHAGLRGMRERMHTDLAAAEGLIKDRAAAKEEEALVKQLDELSSDCEAAGAWGAVELLGALKETSEFRNWNSLMEKLPALTVLGRVIFAYLNPTIVPEDFISVEEKQAAEEAKARAFWQNAPAEGRCPVATWPEIVVQIEALQSCPVIDTAAAAFQMAATGRPSSLAPLMDLTEKDPGLCAQLLIATNKMRRRDDALNTEPVESPRACVSLLGEIRLASIASGLVQADERRMAVGPCTWAKFWMFQVGVARMARYTCHYLEFKSLEPRAYAAGLLHELGRLILLHLYPVGFQTILEYAQQKRVPLSAAEELYFGCNAREFGAHFVTKHGLLPGFANTMRWIDDPARAGEDAVLVASVSLARDLCVKNHVGWTGDIVGNETRAIADTHAWEVLSQRLFPSFDLKKFEAEAHAVCRELKEELRGVLGDDVD